MTAIKDADRLNYTRGPGTAMDVIGNLSSIWVASRIYLGIPRILKTDNQGVGQGEGQTNRTCKQRRAGAIHRRRNKYLGRFSRPVTAAVGIERTIIHCLFLCGSVVSRRGDGVKAEQTDLHIAIIDGPRGGELSAVVEGSDKDALPVPQQEGEWCDEDEVPGG